MKNIQNSALYLFKFNKYLFLAFFSHKISTFKAIGGGIGFFFSFVSFLYYLIALELLFPKCPTFCKLVERFRRYGRKRERGYEAWPAFPLYNYIGQNGPKNDQKWPYFAKKCPKWPTILTYNVFRWFLLIYKFFENFDQNCPIFWRKTAFFSLIWKKKWYPNFGLKFL